MGNVRTPKTIYKNGLVITFYVENKEIYYKISKWNKDGTNLALLEQNKLADMTAQQILDYALQSFSSVGVIEN